MQIGQVMGVAIFGLIFTTTYASSFSADISPETAAVLAQAGATEQFNDPTLALDAKTSEKVSEELLALPGGEAALTAAIDTQRHAVATSTERLFIGSTLAGIVVLALIITMKEIPLRSTFSSEETAQEVLPVTLEPELI